MSVLKLFRSLRFLPLVLSMAALGCHAQNQTSTAAGPEPVQAGVKLSPEMVRRVEIMIRSRSQLPLDAAIAIGEPKKSEFAGFDEIIVTFKVGDNSSHPLSFLISTDGKTLAKWLQDNGYTDGLKADYKFTSTVHNGMSADQQSVVQPGTLQNGIPLRAGESG